MNYILFDDYSRTNLLPFTYTKPICEIRFGILTIKEKWEKHLNAIASYKTEDYLSKKFKQNLSDDNYFINSKICPDNLLVVAIQSLSFNSKLVCNKELIAYRSNGLTDINEMVEIQYTTNSYLDIKNNWHIFFKNTEAIKSDFEFLTKGKTSLPLSATNKLIGNANDLFIEEGAIVEASILNTTSGPIYIGKHAEVMEGSMIRGPFALCDNSTLKMGTKIYGATTIGPHCKVGGEINNSVILGNSNKAHDGFLGNSVIGEWCNLGADTNNSNLKNNYSNVKLYNYTNDLMQDTQLQFCGLMMGDYSKCGINTMFNTGTVVGVGANIFGGDFPPNHIPSFTWGGAQNVEEYKLDKMIETTERVYGRRNITLSKTEKEILSSVFIQTKKYR